MLCDETWRTGVIHRPSPTPDRAPGDVPARQVVTPEDRGDSRTPGRLREPLAAPRPSVDGRRLVERR